MTAPLGRFMARVFARERTWLDPVLRPLERLIYRLTGVDERTRCAGPSTRMTMLAFSVVSMLVLYALQRLQGLLPFNPQGLAGRRARPRLQHRRVVHHQHQLAVVRRRDDDELSDADGGAGVPQLRLGRGRHRAGDRVHPRHRRRDRRDTLGNFWVDMTRATLWVLLPFCVVGALLLVSQGVVQNLKPYDRVQLVDPQTTTSTAADGKETTTQVTEQVIAQGPVASQEIIKEWGTNGGGFFNANSAHPFENPTPLSNFIEMFAIFAISAGLTYTLGHMTRSPRHGWAVWAAMAFLFLAGVTIAYWAEAQGNPLLAGTDQTAGAMCPGGNMEGKEARFGIANSALFATVTTDASCGAVNSMHDSFTPLGGMVPLVNIMLGEVIFGGVGAGMYGILIFVVLSVFIAGLDGRPHAGVSRQEDRSVRRADGDAGRPRLPARLSWSSPASRRSRRTSARRASANPGPHGLSEILYAYTSGTGNNGSAFAGISANTKWYNTTIGIAMLIGRFLIIIPMLALAGNLGRKNAGAAVARHVPGDDAAVRRRCSSA